MTDSGATCRDGVVFAATGPKYTALARRAARNLRAVSPDLPVDLFTDMEIDDPVFDQVHMIREVTTRPKMEALLRSRFERTLYLDSDVVAVAPFPEVFEVLEAFDIAGVHNQYGNGPIPMTDHTRSLPVAFRQVNGGVLGVRKSEVTERLLTDWKTGFETSGLEFDQPVLREMLWDSPARLAVLPVEYNYMHIPYLSNSAPRMAAPRLLHLTWLHVGEDHLAPADQPFDVAALLDEQDFRALQERLDGDRTLGARPSLRDLAGETLRNMPGGRTVARKLRGRMRWLR